MARIVAKKDKDVEHVHFINDLGLVDYARMDLQKAVDLIHISPDIIFIIVDWLGPKYQYMTERDYRFSSREEHEFPKRLLGIRSLLQTCKALHKIISPLGKWTNLADLEKNISEKYYIIDEQVSYDDPMKLVCRLNTGGNAKGLFYSDEMNQGEAGTPIVSWHLTAHLFGHHKLNQIAIETTINLCSEENEVLFDHAHYFTNGEYEKKMTESEFEEELKKTVNLKRRYRSRCGVPSANPFDEGCCHGVVSELVNELWSSCPSTVTLDCNVQKTITDLVSFKCSQPPGMTEDELRIMIAQEISEYLL